jgi:hypothetical protein
MAMHRRPLTDDQSWVIVCATSDITDAQLAAALGVQVSTVHAARWRFRRQGWTCAVRFVACRHCGQLLLRRGRRDSRRDYHDECRPEARKRIQREIDRRRWERADAERRNVVLERWHEHQYDHQAETAKAATRHAARWTEYEDTVLIERNGEPLHVLAYDLGRTLWAVKDRRQSLRRRGLLN